MPPKPTNIKIHDVNPFLQAVRDFLLGRKLTLALRFQEQVASRSPPPPILPDGPAHKLHSNYYFTRDARREATPPEVIVEGTKQIAGKQKEERPKMITPGKVYKWD